MDLEVILYALHQECLEDLGRTGSMSRAAPIQTIVSGYVGNITYHTSVHYVFPGILPHVLHVGIAFNSDASAQACNQRELELPIRFLSIIHYDTPASER